MAASTTFVENVTTYERIFEVVKKLGHTLLPRNDVTSMIESIGNDTLDVDDWRVMCQREHNNLQECDAAIFDATNKATFGVGYYAALALQANKPTLFLLREGSLEGSIITGLEHRMLIRKYFKENTIEGIIRGFLE